MPVYNKYTQFIFLHRKVSVYCLEYSKWWKNSPRTLSRRLALVWAYELQLSISPATPKLSRGIRPDFCLSYSPSTKRMMNCVSSFRVLRVFALPSFTSSEVQASSAPFTSQHCQNFLPHLVSWAIFFWWVQGRSVAQYSLYYSCWPHWSQLLPASGDSPWCSELWPMRCWTLTTQVVCSSTGPPREGQFFRCKGITWF